eukprot:1713321-Rhodomonas_salina.2
MGFRSTIRVSIPDIGQRVRMERGAEYHAEHQYQRVHREIALPYTASVPACTYGDGERHLLVVVHLDDLAAPSLCQYRTPHSVSAAP